MKIKFVSAGVALSALLALAACKSETGTNVGGAGGSVGGAGGIGGAGGSVGGAGGQGGTGGAGVDCNCACGAGQPAALVCNDPAHPSYCAGMAPVAGGQCETALKSDCGFTDADIAALGCTGQ